MSRLRVFAGPNGSGKSTLFRQISQSFSVGPFINADLLEEQLVRSGLINLDSFQIKATEENFLAFTKSASAQSLISKAVSEGLMIDVSLRENYIVDKSKVSHSYESALVAMFLRQMLLQSGKTFSYETVMSHVSKIAEIEQAKKLGFRTYLYFVCTEDPLLNIERVTNRVVKGGHPVSDEKVVSRYYRALEQLVPAMRVCDRTYFFDNSSAKMTLVAEAHSGNLQVHQSKVPYWFADYVLTPFSVDSEPY